MEVGHFKKCRDTLCLSTKVLLTYCFLFSLETIVSPRRIWKQCLCTNLTEKQRVLRYYLKQTIRNEFWRKFTYLIRENRSRADSAHTPCTRTPRTRTPFMPFTLARAIFFLLMFFELWQKLQRICYNLFRASHQTSCSGYSANQW